MPAYTVNVPTAARLLGVGSNTAYELIKRGEWPTRVLHLGKKILIPVADLAELLGVPPGDLAQRAELDAEP